jgi:hypothetical protein
MSLKQIKQHYPQYYYYRMYGVVGLAETYPDRPEVLKAVEDDQRSGFKAYARRSGW